MPPSEFFIAAQEGNIDILRQLTPTTPDKDIGEALEESAFRGHLDAVEELLDFGVERKFREVALHKAAPKGHVECVRAILKYDTSVDALDSSGSTPLLNTAQAGHSECVEVLLDHNANVNVSNRPYATAVHRAAALGHSNIVQMLVEAGCEVNIRDMDGDTPMHCAVQNGNYECVRMLISLSTVDMSIKSSCGWTSVHLAARSGRGQILKYILRNVPYALDLRDAFGATVRDVATGEAAQAIQDFINLDIPRLHILMILGRAERITCVDEAFYDDTGVLGTLPIDILREIAMKLRS